MNSVLAWEAGQCKLSQGPVSRASGQRMGRWLCVYSGISRTIQHPEVPSGPLTRPFPGCALGWELGLGWLSSLSSCLLSRFHSPAFLSTLGTIAPDNSLCHFQKPEVFLLFPPNSRWKTTSVVDSGQAPGFPEDRKQWPLFMFLLS